ncbi:hypothetical protein [Bacillus sp. 03113]|uniref:hypothetical protein n=1 Tax=Bacillus sp. 03113 TaxID=2578211 RepID=UPI001143E200|nr:hypothetical protein [Bacillus sp. 03113]
MWVCKMHVKQAMENLKAPHFYKVPEGYNATCHLCENIAIANMYYSHKPLQYSSKKEILSLKRA